MISVRNFSIYDLSNNIVSGPLNFEISENSINCLLGPNGSGKSSFLKYLTAKKFKTSGEIKYSDLSFAYLPQSYSNDFQIPAQLKDIFYSFEIKNRYVSHNLNENLLWRSCSGGEKQRVLIDLFLNQKADVLLMDEPLNNLDENSKLVFWRSLQELINLKQFNAAVVVSHESPAFIDYKKVMFHG